MFSKRPGETRIGYEEDIDIVEKTRPKLFQLKIPTSLNPTRLFINMDNPIPKYNHGINFYK